jgi:uncharacterized protein (DUF58 family)
VLTPELLKRVRQIEIRSRRLVNSLFLGEYHAVFRGRGIEFSEVREYVPGDDVRTIDWNVTARLGAPFIKKFVEERELTVQLMVDVSASGAFTTSGRTKRELAAEISALLALSAIENQDRVGLLAFSDRVERYVPPAKGRRHVLRLVRDLLSLSPQGRGTSLSTALEFATTLLRRRSVAFIISDFCDPAGFEPPLRIFSHRHDVTAIVLSDPRELELPDIGVVELEDAETGQTVIVDTSDPGVRRQYHEQAEAQRERREHLFRANGIESVEISTASSYVEPLIAFFHKRGRRASSGALSA